MADSRGAPAGPQLDNRRVAAGAIDLAPAGIASLAILAAGLMTPLMAIVLVGWTLFYFFAFESGNGQTLGKRLMGLRVASADGSDPSIRQVATRTLVRVADAPLLGGLATMLLTGERRQRLGDIAAGTVVADARGSEPSAVSAPSEETIPDPLAGFDEPVVQPAEAYEPVVEPEPEPAVEPEPVVEPEPAELQVVVDEEPEGVEGWDLDHMDPEAQPEDEDLLVKPVETVSALDLLMDETDAGEAAPEQVPPAADGDGPERPSL